MGHSRSHDASLTPDQAELLLDIAEATIRAHLDGTRYSGPDLSLLPERLRQPCGAFVTLQVDGRLNGCIGNIHGDEPIGASISKLAIQAAFADPRLPQLRREDLDRLHIEVSLLSPPTAVPATSRSELIEQLVPRETGLIISSGSRHAVFLPSVWGQLPLPDDFIDQLLRKAGLPTDRWPRDMRAEVFTTESFGRHAR
jgi:AmmeMemoRadiSam system protein A